LQKKGSQLARREAWVTREATRTFYPAYLSPSPIEADPARDRKDSKRQAFLLFIGWLWIWLGLYQIADSQDSYRRLGCKLYRFHLRHCGLEDSRPESVLDPAAEEVR
jgi:hypothetical protein